ncbi:transcriptional regulator [Methylobacterium sp. SyP6R]|uniref:transcriptional regulator n=1 Tax=Methylobacterium sp. SyP6R TaxID=2718876 RepID=UPI001F1D9B41|nr:transcriptional regulator [Methylobacterium sp. SyP6R]MCF4127891.1 transcriptional regulator [Methylobacterium sp. SyP6R]
MLRLRIEEAGSARAASRELGVSCAYLIDVRHGRRAAGDRLLAGLGLVRVVVPVEPMEGAAHVA